VLHQEHALFPLLCSHLCLKIAQLDNKPRAQEECVCTCRTFSPYAHNVAIVGKNANRTSCPLNSSSTTQLLLLLVWLTHVVEEIGPDSFSMFLLPWSRFSISERYYAFCWALAQVRIFLLYFLSEWIEHRFFNRQIVKKASEVCADLYPPGSFNISVWVKIYDKVIGNPFLVCGTQSHKAWSVAWT
jgi:hypothetical protein